MQIVMIHGWPRTILVKASSEVKTPPLLVVLTVGLGWLGPDQPGG